ncbi:hypothetical protein BP5796_12361 [Coleophoma crateriformis]|uniref:Aflatoxin biosynthesis ketoreductase nor-1 n=1 Tax=Coleophoma crateriformis TaxID=565419 RepID=A0A3D8Q9H4_9HELO|nr:hypothetical protein BP5796_12361 [Coleophoma crateriformis]
MSQNTTVLITGANRGIGQGLLNVYLARPNTTVIAGVRNPAHATVQSLKDNTPCGQGSQLIVVKIDNTSETDAKAAVDILTSKYRITQLDIVIANAGIARYDHKAAVIPISEVVDHFKTNTIGTLVLFQAVEPLLKASAASPRFVVLSSSLGSIGDMVVEKSTAYGSSKAALNFITKKIHEEYEYLISFPVHPGWVQTDMGNLGAHKAGLEKADVPVDESVKGLMDKIDRATRENSSGRFVTFDDSPLAW